MTVKKKKNYQPISWIIIVSFFILGIIDTRFGIFGLVCMGAPIYHALKGEGKAHCARYCPRGSFLARFLERISFGNNLPAKYRSRAVKNGMLMLMITLLSLSLSHTDFSFSAVSFVLLRFMFMSFMVGIVMGVIFKPRTWCQVCPMGHAAGLAAEQQRRQNRKPATA